MSTSKSDWLEDVPTWSIHGEAASPREVERLASELMECRALLWKVWDVDTLPDWLRQKIRAVLGQD